MKIRIGYGVASVWYDDANKMPTPEHVDDLLTRLERTLDRIWQGKTVDVVDLSEHEDDD